MTTSELVPTETILQIGSRTEFTVSRYLYRHDKLRAKCKKLEKAGFLKFVGLRWKDLAFVTTELGKQELQRLRGENDKGKERNK